MCESKIKVAEPGENIKSLNKEFKNTSPELRVNFEWDPWQL